MDTQRAFGLYGGLFNVSALQIHGRNLSADNLLNLADRERHRGRPRDPPVGALVPAEIPRTTGWTSRSASRASTRNSWSAQNAHYFINTMFGWPMVPSADLPGGGPAYPLSALGVRARAHRDGFGHHPGRRVQRQPGRQQFRRSADAKPVRHQLSAQRRRAGDRRVAISPILRPARWFMPIRADPLPALTRSASGTTPKASPTCKLDNSGLSLANPGQQRRSRRAITAITRSTPSRTR